MKKQTLLSTLVMAAIFAACSNEETTSVAGENRKVNFVIQETVSRTVTNGNITTFVEGDAIGITSSGLDIDMSNATYAVGANGSLSGGSFYYDGNNKGTFYAHYPITSKFSEGTVSMSVPANQATETAFNACDFMTSTAIGDPTTGGTVVLKFKHRLALVKVIWNGSTTAKGVSLLGVKPTVTWTHATDACETSGNAIDINLWKQDGKQEYWALIPEQTLAKGSQMLTIEDADKNFSYTLSTNLAFSANNVKKITLNVTEAGDVEAAISEIDIENWDEDTNDGGGIVEEVILPPVELISEAEGKNITLTPNSKNNAVAGAWNVAIYKPSTGTPKSVIEAEEGVLHLNVDTIAGVVDKNNKNISGNWWDNAVYFRPSETLAAKIKPALYKLTFEAKASAAGKGFMVQVMKGDESANTYFGISNVDPTTKDDVTYNRMYYPSFKEEDFTDNGMGYKTMTYWVDFAKVLDKDGGDITDEKVGDYEKVLLTLSVNTGTSDANAYGVDFWFKNFTLIEVK